MPEIQTTQVELETPGVANDSAITVNQLIKCYRRLIAVDNISLSIPRGCVFGLIGPNGAGKTTLIKMIMGLIDITSGQASVLGMDSDTQADSIHRRVGFVPEVPTIYRWMKVGQVIKFCRTFRDTWDDAYCQELLEKFELDPAKKVKDLSKGTLAKLSLLLALAYKPEVLILDEPTSGLDAVIREEVVDSILGVICQKQCTVLFSSHAIEDVERIADRVGLIFNGKLHLNASVNELLSTTRRISIVLKDGSVPNGLPNGTIWQQIEGREWQLTVTNFIPDVVTILRAITGVENIEVSEISLTQFFKDYVKGQKVKQ